MSKILGLDIATKDSGWAILENGKPINWGPISCHKGDFQERIKPLYQSFKGLLKNLEYDEVCLTMAPVMGLSVKVISKIKTIEGLVLGLILESGKPFQVMTDTSWQNFLRRKGEPSIERKTKKERAMAGFLKIAGREAKSCKWEGSSKLTVITTLDEVITDDISDAAIAVYLLPKIKQKMIDDVSKNETQEEINKLTSENTAKRNKIKALDREINNRKAERKDFEKEYVITNSKVSKNKIDKRNEYIKRDQDKQEVLEQEIEANKVKIKELREKRG